MNKTMRKIGSLLIACLLTILSLFGSAATAEELLKAMMDISLKAGKTIEGTIRIDAGALLGIMGMSPDGSDPTAAVVYDLLNNGLLRVRYSQTEASDIIGIALELREETIVSLEARTANDEISLETNLLPGKTLVMPAELITQAVTAQVPSAVDEGLLEALGTGFARYAAIFEGWAAQSEGVYSALEEPIPATQTRDAAARSTKVRVTAKQWQALVGSLVEEFVKDEALLQMLAPQMGMEPAALAEMAQQLADSLGAPQFGAIEATVFTGEGEQVIGVDMQIQPPASSPVDAAGALEGSFSYAHLSIDEDHDGDSYEASFTWGDGEGLSAQFSRQDKVPSQFLPDEGEKYFGRARLTTPDTGAMELEVQGDIRQTVEPIAETYDHTFTMRLSQVAEGTDAFNTLGADAANALAQMVQAPLLDAGFTLSSQTEAIGIDDFHSQGSFTLQLMGMEAAIHYTLESSAYTPAEHPENTVVRLDALTPEETDALTMELMQNAFMLLGSMLPMPELVEGSPALSTYRVDDESVASIDSIVGFREITNSEAGITEGKPYVITYYAADSALDDLQAYIDFLIDDGWAVTGMEGDASSGTVQLVTESAIDGKLLMITSDFNTDGYSILLHRTSGTLARFTDADGNQLGEVTFTDGSF